MNQFFLQHGRSKELEAFAHILEFGIRKNTSIQLDSFSATTTESIRIYYILDGKFEWVIKDQHHLLYPGDLAVVLPGQSFRGERDFMDIGSFIWINIQIDNMESNGKLVLGNWSGLSESERLTI